MCSSKKITYFGKNRICADDKSEDGYSFLKTLRRQIHGYNRQQRQGTSRIQGRGCYRPECKLACSLDSASSFPQFGNVLSCKIRVC